MKGIVITHPGLQAVAAKETKDIIGKDCTIRDSVALFDTDEVRDFCTLCYRSQSAMRVLQLFTEFEVERLEDSFEAVQEYDLLKYLKGKTFSVRAWIVNNDSLDTMETEREVGRIVYEKYSKDGVKVSLEDPDVPLFVYVIGKSFYFGIDFAGFDLSKRNYRLFCQSDSVKGTIAYSLVRLASYKKGLVFVDPFSQSGTVSIEAAFYASGKPVRFYEKDRFAFHRFPHLAGLDIDGLFGKHDLFDDSVKDINCFDGQHRHVRAAEKNAKVVGLQKLINFSRTEVEWLDTKFEKESVDCIATNPPRPSTNYTSDSLEKAFQEFFYTADFILKPDGKVVILGKNYPKLLGLAQRYNFTL
ncbi:TPA: methyltransferase, partial [Candidatus Woesearchaeota archaeon]|nr:methyltransferase [Candidatus Woesearchaeota archaeon]